MKQQLLTFFSIVRPFHLGLLVLAYFIYQRQDRPLHFFSWILIGWVLYSIAMNLLNPGKRKGLNASLIGTDLLILILIVVSFYFLVPLIVKWF